ncbi:ribonuclease H-like domain-containing protein [Mycena alexandri]|uniref:Ribonuclease H-like domain-containing protein n=1 Tax=Mycena alexandri TaxID=1745969 RepID=A0AAD6S374_9AGAR|nr:ribonuclease H-like domain-containing protein [Mycena alexandri]
MWIVIPADLSKGSSSGDTSRVASPPPPRGELAFREYVLDVGNEGPELTKVEEAALATSIVVMGELNVATVTYVTSESQANTELVAVVRGVVGFDTEFVKRKLYGDEAIIENMPVLSASAKKTARLAIQHLETLNPGFSIFWDNVGLCLIQIAQGDTVWILNMSRIRAYPSELRRILESPDIAKAGAGITNDGAVIWEDLRSNMKNLVDVGLMTRLWGVDKHKEEPFGNIALDVAALEVLDINIDKTYQKNVDWKLEPNKAHLIYAAIDAAASLRLHEMLASELIQEEQDLGIEIRSSWYTFNSTFGEPMRIRKSIRDAEIPWSSRDCTWYSNNKFQGSKPKRPHNQQASGNPQTSEWFNEDRTIAHVVEQKEQAHTHKARESVRISKREYLFGHDLDDHDAPPQTFNSVLH